MQKWDAFLKQQEEKFGKVIYDTWLKNLRIVSFDACNIYLEAMDSFHALWFEEHIRPQLTAFTNSNGHLIKVHLTVQGNTPKEGNKKKEPVAQTTFSLNFPTPERSFLLKEFYPTEENQIALKIIEDLIQPDALKKAFPNPLVFYGPPGSGKTHLLTAVYHELQEKGYQPLYVTAEQFADHVVRAIRAGQMTSFRARYRSAGALIIDDIEVFGKKAATQEEFFHTFNTLHTAQKLIVLSSHTPLQTLEHIEPRLVSRFEWGLSLPIKPLTKKELIHVLVHRSKFYHMEIPERTAIYFTELFQTPTSAVKALKTFIERIKKSKKLYGPSVISSLSAVREFLSDLIEIEEKSKLTKEKILATVSHSFGIPVEDILGKAQNRECIVPRKIAMFLMRKYLELPYMSIGDIFSRDHSTVMSALRQIEKELTDLSSTLPGTISKIEGLLH